MTELFEKPQVEMKITEAPEEKPKKKKKNFTAEQKAAFVERMKKAREAKLLKKAKELNEKKEPSKPIETETKTEIIEKPKKTRKPRQKKEEVAPTTQPHANYDYSYIQNLNTSINQLNQNLMNLASRSQPQPKPKPQVVETEASTKKIKKEELKEEPKVETKVKMAEIPQKATTQNNPTEKRKIWNATRRAYVYV